MAYQNENTEDVCTICLDEMQPGTTTYLPCFHRFHTQCIFSHVTYRVTRHLQPMCPLCNAQLPILHNEPLTRTETNTQRFNKMNKILSFVMLVSVIALILYMLLAPYGSSNNN